MELKKQLRSGNLALDSSAVITFDKLNTRGSTLVWLHSIDSHAIYKDVDDLDLEDYEPYDMSSKGIRLLCDKQETDLRNACSQLIEWVQGILHPSVPPTAFKPVPRG